MAAVRRRLLCLTFLAGLFLCCYAQSQGKGSGSDASVLKVGVLFSQSGRLASSEEPLLHATLWGIEQVNELGLRWNGETRLRLQAIVRDGASDPAVFARQTRELIRNEGVRILLGCATSDSRKAVLKVLRQEGGLLFYPLQSEDDADSPQCIYSGLTAQQQIIPALNWLLREGHRRIYLLGSEGLFARSVSRLARQYLASKGAQVVGESSCRPGTTSFDKVVKEIVASRAQGVLNTINGDRLTPFFQTYGKAGLNSDSVPVMCTSMGEMEVGHIGPSAIGQYAACGYFMTLDSAHNRRFIRKYRQVHGPDAVVDDPTVSATYQVFALAQAVVRSHSTDPGRLRESMRGLVVDTPGGLLRYDPRNLKCWRVIRIGRVQKDGQFQVVWSSELPLRPAPASPGREMKSL